MGNTLYEERWPDGALKLRGMKIDGKKEGKWQGWYRSGTSFWEGCFAGDVQTGLWKRWRYDGIQLCEGYFSKGYMVGTWNHLNYDRNGYDPFGDENDLFAADEIDENDLFATEEELDEIDEIDMLESMYIYTEPAWENWDFIMPPADVYSLFREQYGSSVTVMVWSTINRLYMTKTYKDGKPRGIWKKWYPNGRIRQQRDFMSNCETGWYENGKVALCGRIRENKRGGMWTGWYGSGRKKWEGVFSNDVLNGAFTRWTDDGSMECTGVLGNGFMTGTWHCQEYNKYAFRECDSWKNWHAFNYPFFDWPLEPESYWPDQDNGMTVSTQSLDITCVIRYINGNKHSEYHYRNGLPFGSWKCWKVNGALELVKTYDLSGGKGTIRYLYPDGTPECTVGFITNNLDGHVTVWYPSGQKEMETWYDSGTVTGMLACFHEDGTEQIPGEYTEKYLPYWQAENEEDEIRINMALA